jgi:hypothetical protein
MIAINLLPEDRRPAEGTPWPRFLVILVGVAGFCLEVVFLGMFFLKIRDMGPVLTGLKLNKGTLETQANRVSELERDINLIKRRGSEVQKLINDRRDWAPILHRLCDRDILPPAIWFKAVSLRPAGRGRRGAAGGGGKMELVLEGYARGPDSGTMFQEVTIFETNLREKLYEEFPKHFGGEGGGLVVTVGGVKTLPKVRDAPSDAPKEAVSFTVTMPMRTITVAAPAGRSRRAKTPGG